MFNFNFHLTYDWLSFSQPSGPPSPVPKGLERHWVDTAQGTLEILSAKPTTTPTGGPPVFFCHGGMGCAWMWTEYMQYLAAQGVPCYAISLRGHGDSWHPSYLRMVFGTTRRMLEGDLVAGIQWVEAREGRQVVLVGHSSGGGLSQAVLSQGRVDVKGLALLGAVPAFGS
jgi:pimeloyl-ACP methyl ester carboxylesterase